jgi:dephospho-CoA kinase
VTLVVGLTGPIGCGKSAVAAMLGELGASVIDADRVAHEVTAPGTPALAAIVETFGASVVRPDGGLDRPALGRIVFGDPVALERLEEIVHPAVRPAILDRIAAAQAQRAPAVVIEAIKLVEGGLAALCDEVWLVLCDPAEQRARLAGRGQAAADAEARIAAQSDIVERLLPSATRVLDTSGPMEDMRALVTELWTAIAPAPAPSTGERGSA